VIDDFRERGWQMSGVQMVCIQCVWERASPTSAGVDARSSGVTNDFNSLMLLAVLVTFLATTVIARTPLPRFVVDLSNCCVYNTSATNQGNGIRAHTVNKRAIDTASYTV